MSDANAILEEVLRLQQEGGVEALDTIRELLDGNGLCMIDGRLEPADGYHESYLSIHPPHPEQSGFGG